MDLTEAHMKRTSIHYNRIKEFMKLAGQDTPKKPIEPSSEIRKLRAKLILEEALETISALGFEVYPDRGYEDSLPLEECILMEKHKTEESSTTWIPLNLQ